MAYDETLASRVRTVLRHAGEVREQQMFGGLAFMVEGGMACGIMGDGLLVRVGRDRYEHALAQPHARPMAFSDRRPMRGFVIVGPEGVAADADLVRWVERGVAVARSLAAEAGDSAATTKVRSRRRSGRRARTG